MVNNHIFFRCVGMVCTIMFFLCDHLCSQNVFSHVYNYNFRDGLNIGIVQMSMDYDHNIWFKDHNTLGIYNGNRFIYFIHDEVKKNSCPRYLSDLIADHNGHIWISAGDGIYNYSKSQEFIRHIIYDQNIKPTAGFITLTANKDGQIWCGNLNGQIFLYDPIKKKTINIYNFKSIGAIRKLLQTNDGQLWIVSTTGFYVKPLKGEIKRIKQFEIKTLFPDDNIFRISALNNGNILFNYKSSLYEFNADDHSMIRKHVFNNLNNYHINDFLEVNKDEFIIASNKGIFEYNAKKFNTTQAKDAELPKDFNIESEFVNTILKTKNNILFFGTSKGLSKIQRHAEQFINFDLGYNINSKIIHIKSLNKWNNDWVVISESDGIFRFDPNLKTAYKINGFAGKNINNVFISADQFKLYWIEENKLLEAEIGSSEILGAKFITNLPSINNRKAQIDDSGNIYYFNGTELFQFNIRNKLLKSFKTPAAEIIDILVEDDGKVYIAGNGLWKMHNSGHFEKLPVKTDEKLHSLERGLKNQIYAGAYSGLLVFNENNKQTRKLSLKNGLLRDYTGSLKKIGKYLWITYLEGLQKLNLQNGNIETYSYENGLADNYSLVNLGMIDSNIMYLGKYGYFTYLKPPQRSHFSKIHFSVDHIFIDSIALKSEIEDGHTIDIPANSRQVILNFNFPAFLEKSLYTIQYRIKNDKDSTWLLMNNDLTLEFTELIPKKYDLEVRAFEKLNPHSVRSFSLSMIVAAPFYSTIWFQTVMKCKYCEI